VAGALKKAMVLLGLGNDEDFDDYEPAPASASGSAQASRSRAALGNDTNEGLAQVRTISSRPTRTESPLREQSARPDDTGPVTIRRPSPPAPARPDRGQPNGTPHSIEPRAFNDAKEVADVFKTGQPVIVNLQNVDRDLMKRIIDFCSGLTYAMNGSIKKVANGVFLLTPPSEDE
jgi:cell division inhibitor SepF